jgi:HSP20 family protein
VSKTTKMKKKPDENEEKTEVEQRSEVEVVPSELQDMLWPPDFKRMRDVMESLWQRPLSQHLSHIPIPGLQLQLNMYRDDNDLVVEANMPGVDKKDINIKVENNNLTIEAEHKDTTENDNKEHFFKEIRRQHFFRRVSLPMEVDEENTKATYKDGILQMRFPILKPDAALAKTIKVE